MSGAGAMVLIAQAVTAMAIITFTIGWSLTNLVGSTWSAFIFGPLCFGTGLLSATVFMDAVSHRGQQ